MSRAVGAQHLILVLKGATGGSAELYQLFNLSGFQPMGSTGVKIHAR